MILRKSVLMLALAAGICGVACAQALDTDEAKESYSLGASVGNYLSNQIYKQGQLGAKADVNLVVEGFVDALKNKGKLSEDDMLKYLNSRAEKLNKLYEARLDQVKQANKKMSEDLLAKNKAKKGVVTTKSGLQYEVKAEGKGDKRAKEEDVVTLEYVGKFADGIDFVGTAEKPIKEDVVMMTLFPGLKEGIGLMKEGAEYRFVIPASLAYGEGGTDTFPPNMALVFDVKLIKIEKPKAGTVKGGMGSMMGQPKKQWPHT